MARAKGEDRDVVEGLNRKWKRRKWVAAKAWFEARAEKKGGVRGM